MLKVYHTKDADRRVLNGLSIGIIGYGSQGRAQALNLRDSGIISIIGLPTRSRSRRNAHSDGFAVTTVRLLVKRCNILCFLAPDHLHGSVFHKDVRDWLRPGQILVFSHAASLHFGAVRPPDFVDTILIAPLGPGKRLRELYGKRPGVACFFAVHHDATGRAHRVGLALAQTIGCLQTGAIETTFAEEAVGDLFGEQAVLCGGLSRLLKLGFDTLVDHGLSPEKAYLECVYQIDLIVDLVKAHGIAGMLDRISPTAGYGAVTGGPRVLADRLQRNFETLYHEIESGRFFARLTRRPSGEGIDRSQLTSPQFENAARRVRQLLENSDT